MAQVALTSDQLTSLRGTSSVPSTFVNRVRISVCPNDIVYSMRINQASFTDSFAQITYDGGSGDLDDVYPGMRVIISHTNDITAGYWEGIVRKAPTSTVLYVNENSFDLSDNDYIWIVEDFTIKDKLARLVAGVQSNYFDIAFRQLLPVIYNINTVYAGDISSGVLTLSFAPLAFAATSGASISSWLWDVRDGTITVGSTTTQNITATFPEGHRYIHLKVTDSGGRALTRHIEIHAHGDTYTYQLMAVDNVQIKAPVATGYDGTLTNYVAPAGLLDLTRITIWSDDSYQTGDGSLTGDNIIFEGRIRNRENKTEASEQYILDQSTDYTLEGALTQLARTEQLPFEMLNVASPTKWGDIKDMTLYRGIVYLLSEYSTFLELYSLEFDAFDNTFLAPTRNPDGDILAAVNDLALSINAALQIDPSGHALVVRHGSMLEDTAARNALATRANITTSDLTSFSLRQDGARPVGLLSASAGSYNSTTNLYLVTEARAPGTAQESGSDKRTLARQVLPANLAQSAADTRLRQRAKDAHEKEQGADEIEATFTPGWYSALIPSLNTWYTFTLDAEITVDGQVTSKSVMTSDIRWLLVNVELGLNAEGVPEVKATFLRETRGITKGFTVTYPAPVTNTTPSYPPIQPVPMFPTPPIELPDIPPGTAIPPGGVILTLPLDGNAWVMLGKDADDVQQLLLTTTMFYSATPYTRDIVPTDLTATEEGRDLKINPYVSRGLYALYFDTAAGTSSIRYTDDCTAYPVTWTKGADVTGEFTELRIVFDGNGKVKIAGLGAGTTYSDPLTSALGASSHVPSALFPFGFWQNYPVLYTGTSNSGVYNSSGGRTGGGRIEGQDTGYNDGISDKAEATLIVDLGAEYTVTEATMWSNSTHANDQFVAIIAFMDGSGTLITRINDTNLSTTGWRQSIWDGVQTGVRYVVFTAEQNVNDGNPSLDDVVVIYGSQNSSVYSDDFGATLSSPEAIGSGPGWFDTQKDGSVSLAGGDGQTRTSDAGGAWSDYGSAKTQGAGFLPRYLFPPGSASNDSANPEYALFASALDGGESMWRVTSSGAAFTDITPSHSGNKGLSINTRNFTGAWQNANHILAIGLFDTVVLLAVSLDKGATWHFSSVSLDPDAFNIVTQRGSTKVVGLINGDVVSICRNYQATTPVLADKTTSITTYYAIDVFG